MCKYKIQKGGWLSGSDQCLSRVERQDGALASHGFSTQIPGFREPVAFKLSGERRTWFRQH